MTQFKLYMLVGQKTTTHHLFLLGRDSFNKLILHNRYNNTTSVNSIFFTATCRPYTRAQCWHKQPTLNMLPHYMENTDYIHTTFYGSSLHIKQQASNTLTNKILQNILEKNNLCKYSTT